MEQTPKWDLRILQSNYEGAQLLTLRAITDEDKFYASKRMAETRIALEAYLEEHKPLPTSGTTCQSESNNGGDSGNNGDWHLDYSTWK